MTAGWIVYGLLVGGLLALTARCLDSVCRLAGRPTRWVWFGTLMLAVLLIGVMPRRQLPLPAPAPVVATSRHTSIDPAAVAALVRRAHAGESSVDRWTQRVARTRAMAATAMQTALDAASAPVPRAAGRYFALAWLALSMGLLVLFAATYSRFYYLRRRWPVGNLHGARVRIATNGGPLVVGVFRPEIVVPHWLLARTADEQRLVLAHEREHVRARDPVLIVIACVAAALVPWHPAVWWMFGRLRLAIELDCDRRVLRRGAAARAYGALLIDLAGRSSGLAGAAALADTTSHLQRRLLAMKPIRERFALARGGAFGMLALLFFGIAWTARVPLAAAQDANSSAARRQMEQAAVDSQAAELQRQTADLQRQMEALQRNAARLSELRRAELERAAHAGADSDGANRGAVDNPGAEMQAARRLIAEQEAGLLIADTARAAGAPQWRAQVNQQLNREQLQQQVEQLRQNLATSMAQLNALSEQLGGQPGPRGFRTVTHVDSASPLQNLTDLLENRVPGLSVRHSAADSAANPARPLLRGVGSVVRNNDPVVIVDGVRVYSSGSSGRIARINPLTGQPDSIAAASPLDQIDPNIIEKIEVFKGQSAAVLYGADAANGVIVITTKRGKKQP